MRDNILRPIPTLWGQHVALSVSSLRNEQKGQCECTRQYDVCVSYGSDQLSDNSKVSQAAFGFDIMKHLMCADGRLHQETINAHVYCPVVLCVIVLCGEEYTMWICPNLVNCSRDTGRRIYKSVLRASGPGRPLPLWPQQTYIMMKKPADSKHKTPLGAGANYVTGIGTTTKSREAWNGVRLAKSLAQRSFSQTGTTELITILSESCYCLMKNIFLLRHSRRLLSARVQSVRDVNSWFARAKSVVYPVVIAKYTSFTFTFTFFHVEFILMSSLQHTDCSTTSCHIYPHNDLFVLRTGNYCPFYNSATQNLS